MAENILTVDAGTTALKCSLISSRGALLDCSIRPYEVFYTKDGGAQQPFGDTLGALCSAVREITSRNENTDIAAIGLSGTMNGCLPVDKEGLTLYPNMIHADLRAGRQVEAIRAVVGDREYYRRTGNRLDVHYTLPKILWLRENEPEIYRKTSLFLNIKDALRAFLTGNFHTTDYSDASLTGMMNIERRAWDEELLASLGIARSLLPQTRASHEIDSFLTAEASKILNLKQGIPVVVGAGDGACATHGAGVYKPGEAYCNIGSSAWLAALSDSPIPDEAMRAFHFIDMDGKLVNVCCTVQSGAEALDWAVRTMLDAGIDDGEKIDFSVVEAMAEQSEPGAGGLFFLPTLMGERTPWWDPDARGTLIGMTLRHSKSDLALCFYEGVAEALRLCDEVLRENAICCSSLSLIGGGAQSRIWPQIFADLFGIPTRVHRSPRAATSLGAAIAAGVGAGIFSDYAQASSRIAGYEKAYDPDPIRRETYARHFSLYRTLYEPLRNSYKEIARFQS